MFDECAVAEWLSLWTLNEDLILINTRIKRFWSGVLAEASVVNIVFGKSLGLDKLVRSCTLLIFSSMYEAILKNLHLFFVLKKYIIIQSE